VSREEKERKEIVEKIKIVRQYLKEIQARSPYPSVERCARLADIYCSLAEAHLNEQKELWG